MPTIHDIAKKAGVSPGLVSLALSGKPRVSPITADKIIKIANAMGYRRRIARAPGAGALRFVRVSSPDSPFRSSHAPFFGDYIEGAESHLKNRGYRFEVSSHHTEPLDDVFRTLASDNLQGIILLATELAPHEVEACMRHAIPMVVLDACHPFIDLDHCTMNNQDAIHQALLALRNLGHRKIGLVTALNQTYNLARRTEAFQQSVQLLELPVKPGWIYQAPSDATQAARVLAALFRRRRPPPALVCLTDTIAYGCLQALAETGYRVADDVSVMGFDDLPSSRFMHPPLSTIRVPTRAMGAAAARLLDARLAQPDKPVEKVLFGCEVIMRKSVRALS